MSKILFGGVFRERTIELHRSQGFEVAARCVSCRSTHTPANTEYGFPERDFHSHSTLAFCVPNPSGATPHLKVTKEFPVSPNSQQAVEGSVVQLNYLPSDPRNSVTVR